MGFFDWLKRLFGGGPIKRDVARLGGAPDSIDDVEEVVDTSGGPLREGRRRRALRDRRLLPKKKKAFTKRKRVMSADEANRLFAGTLRTKNRKIRDLLPDEEQLERYGLPVWRTEEELANALSISIRDLRFFSIHREKDRTPHYVSFAVAKRTGGTRVIMAPKRKLKALQRKLHDRLATKLPKSDAAHGFVKGRSTKTAAAPHVRKKLVMRIDLADFFPTITYARVRGLLIALGYSYPVAATLATLMTEAERQPVELDGALYHVPIGPRYCVQGAPTSPAIANAIAQRLDRRLLGLAKKLNLKYTRYADDLIFSGDDPTVAAKLLGAVRKITTAEGFPINVAKTRIHRRSNRQVVTGVIVNDVLGLSRKDRRRLRAAIDHANQGKLDPSALATLRGRLAYLHGLNAEQAAKLRARFR
jgi:retron-type reverse transcriptase